MSIRDCKFIQYKILRSDIRRVALQTVRRITNEILGVKGLKRGIQVCQGVRVVTEKIGVIMISNNHDLQVILIYISWSPSKCILSNYLGMNCDEYSFTIYQLLSPTSMTLHCPFDSSSQPIKLGNSVLLWVSVDFFIISLIQLSFISNDTLLVLGISYQN